MFKSLKTACFALLLVLLGAGQVCACAAPASAFPADTVAMDNHEHEMPQDMECLDVQSDECIKTSLTALVHGPDLAAVSFDTDKSKWVVRAYNPAPQFEEIPALERRKPPLSFLPLALSPVLLRTRLLN